MKISCILISLICVNVIMMANIGILNYIELVEISNAQLQKAKVANGKGLENVLTNMIDVEHYNMKNYNQMFTVPELAETHNYNLLQKAIMTEKYDLQPKIFDIIGNAVDEPKSIPVADESNQSKETSKCLKLGETAKNIVTKSFKMIGRAPHDNEKQSYYPEPDDKFRRTYIAYAATRSQTSRLKELGKARRDITGNAIINVLTQKLDEFISGGQKYPVKKICVLIGIWVSLKMISNTSPTNNGDVCEIELLGNKSKKFVMYRPLDGIYCQIKANDINSGTKKLTAQLRENLSIPLEFI
ncbi:uncharacterized protein LOC126845073 [Adelges cooleyi]|uniref:uncharacterized protein LOC126845073 n=1 Tax=Adelges cooleyi TaxID=133065 RepID=UPI00218025CB|nr:uncharacterized protein LOC126845073 [Adelges cooleyi]